MLKVVISSDQTRQFKTTIALLLQETLDGLGIRSEISVDTPHINYLDNLDALAEFSKKDPVMIVEVVC